MKLAFVGDIMLGRLISNKFQHHPYNLIAPKVEDDLRKNDLVIANLESPIIRSNIEVKDHMCFCGNPEFLKQFSWVNLFSTANNHINDFGQQGIHETLEELDKAGIGHNGIHRGDYCPYIDEHQKLAIITLTDLMNHDIEENSGYKLLRMDNPSVTSIINKYSINH